MSDILIQDIIEATNYNNIGKDLDSFTFNHIQTKPEILFTKITDEQVSDELEKLSQIQD